MTDNIFNTFNDEDLGDEQEDFTPLSIEEMEKRIPSFSKEKLCEIIVCDRYFNCYNDLAILCMKELGQRRANGLEFDFESYIENSLNELPKLHFTMPNITDVLKQFVRKGK